MIERIFQAFLIFCIVLWGLTIFFGPRGVESYQDYKAYRMQLQASVDRMEKLSEQLKATKETINNQKKLNFDGVFTKSQVHNYRHPQLTEAYIPYAYKGWIPPFGALIVTMLYVACSLFIYRAKRVHMLKTMTPGTEEL